MKLYFSPKRLLLIVLSAALSMSLLTVPSKANEYSCLNSVERIESDPLWIPSQDRDLKFTVTWAFRDPENCIVGVNPTSLGQGKFSWSDPGNIDRFEFSAVWNLYRESEITYITAEGIIPEQLLLQYKNDGRYELFSQTYQPLKVQGSYVAKSGTKEIRDTISGSYGLPQLWGVYLSKKQGGNRLGCKPFTPDRNLDVLNSRLSLKIVQSGLKPVVKIAVQDDFDCIFLVHTGPLTAVSNPDSWETAKSVPPDKLDDYFAGTIYPKTHLAQYAFWQKTASAYWNSLVSNSKQVLQVGIGDFTDHPQSSFPTNFINKATYFNDIDWTPIKSSALTKVLEHTDEVTRIGSTFEITTTIESADISQYSLDEIVTFYVGYYWWYRKASQGFLGGWTVTTSGNRVTATYSKGGAVPGGAYMAYTTRAIKVPLRDLLSTQSVSTDTKVIETKDDSYYQAIAAAEIAKFEEELRVRQEAEAKAAVDKAAAELKAKQDKEAEASAAKKKTTITCTRGKLLKKVTAIKPKCPTGYRLKK
jgi:hypothetical protein